ncbi:MAG TPA: dihydrolipoamide acetyltransferase family protein [Gemmatimonadales bacterium]|nr:dihydrolipoamide acetyltransferase family protein [Gemmatimonadales bacterium]
MGEFRMPSLGADMVAGTLTEWYKHPGDTVHRGDIIAAVDTDKGSIDVEVFEDGVLDRVVVEEGRKVPVGTLLAVIRAEGAAPSAGPPPPAPAPAAPAPAVPLSKQPPAAAPSPAPTPGARFRVSPVARRLAAERGVDLATIKGSGPDGAILQEDVEAAAGVGDRRERMRRAIAAAMARSKREIPHFYLTRTIDFAAAADWLSRWNAERKPAERLLPTVLLLKATALALRDYPELNARWEEGRVQPAGAVHVGVATYLHGGGLVILALHHVDQQTLPALMRDLRGAVDRARTGTLRSSDLSDATITVTSLGEDGSDSVLGVIYPPQTAVVGFGTILERPWVIGSQVGIRKVVTASLAADHRATDGHRGAGFLAALAQLLQSPEAL